jgi:carbon-monoxide dehydrogenase large subunit
MMTDAHARDHVTKARMGFDRDGHILGLTVDTIAGFGGYQSSFNAVIPGGHYPIAMSGLYRTPAVHVRVTGAYTNTTPIDAYRGSIQSSTSVGERLLENGARALGIEVAEIRARNYLGADEYPYTTPVGTN